MLMDSQVSGTAPFERAATADETREPLLADYRRVRRFTRALCDGLEVEDFVVQSMPDVSPTKWHLAHTSWFFETFVLMQHDAGYQPLDPTYQFLFNSYYVQAGERHCRAQRGYISRPTVREVLDYRAYVDEHMEALLAADGLAPDVAALIELGTHHEQQHQELMLTDIKHVFSVNPLRPAYRPPPAAHLAANAGAAARPVAGSTAAAPPSGWVAFPDGVYEIGHDGAAFHYDNETPRHRQFLEPFEIATRLVTNGEFLEFMEDGGYRRPELWLSAGWDAVQQNEWSEPFYWERRDGRWQNFTLHGMRDVAPDEPVCHVSYFEADAYARWRGARLPTEFEWEVAAADAPVRGNFVESGALHPRPAAADAPARMIQQLYGDVWEWTRSQYTGYPGYQPAAGAVGEYNGKWMCNQFVLRGGSCATSYSHIRRTYRNFFPPDATWQFMGFRLARDV
jgi:ergothioneine biosynthesis protein EgtB